MEGVEYYPMLEVTSYTLPTELNHLFDLRFARFGAYIGGRNGVGHS